jgi:hypothetical protein
MQKTKQPTASKTTTTKQGGKSMPKTMKVHPAARMFQHLEPDEMNDLREDIRTNGIRVPIVLNKKKDTILDGRNRWMIATELGLKWPSEIPHETFTGKEQDIPAEILRLNVFRRHLTEDQRTAAIVKVRGPQLEKEAKTRQGQAGKSGSFKKNGEKGTSVAQMAKEAKTTTYKVSQAEKARKAGLIDDVVEKKMTLKQAAKKAGTKSRRPRKELSFEDDVWARWKRFMNNWPTTQHQRVFDCVIEFLSDRNPETKRAEAKAAAAKETKDEPKKKAPAKEKRVVRRK